jgi:ketosteroid isomerase-like protein
MIDSAAGIMQSVIVGTADPDIIACEVRIRAAQLGADVNALDELIGEPLLFTGPDGQLGTKAQDLDAYRSGIVRFRIRRIGTDVAVSALRVRLTVEVRGTLVHGTYRYTRVWAREDGGPWRVVAGHVSAVPDA